MKDSVWNKITDIYGDNLSKERVSELYKILGGDVVLMIFRIGINTVFFTTEGLPSRSSSFSDSTGSVNPEILKVVQLSANYSGDTKPAAKPAAKPDVIDLCASSSDSDNGTTTTPVASKKSKDRRETSDTNKTFNSLSSFVQQAGKTGKAIFDALRCPNSSNKRRPDRVPTTIARQETGARNVDMKKARPEGIDGEGGNNNNLDTDVSVEAIEVMMADEENTPPPQDNVGDTAAPLQATEVPYVEDLFNYNSEDDDSEDDAKVSPDLMPASKPAAKLDASTLFPPQELSISRDIGACVENMNNIFHLNKDIRAPNVEHKDLSQPTGLDHTSRMKLMARKGALAAHVSQGHTIHDTTELKSQGFSEDVAKRVVYCNNSVAEHGGNDFSVKIDHTNKEFCGLFCNSCNEELDDVRNCRVDNITRIVKKHSGKCTGACPCCGLSAATMYDSYKEDKYLVYKAQLCKGETAVLYDNYIESMKSYSSELGGKNSRYFFMSQFHLFTDHMVVTSGKSSCESWYKMYEKFQKYVHTYKSTKVEKKKIEDLFSLSSKDANRLQTNMINFIRKYYVANEDGSYGGNARGVGSMSPLGNNFTGLRHTKMHAIHVWLEQEQTKGMKKLTKMRFSTSKK